MRITSTGAGAPVHSSKLAAPWATSTSRPSSTRAPAARRGLGRRGARIREIDQRLPRPELEQHLVPDRRRVDHEVGVPRTSGRPLPTPGEDARLRQRAPKRRRRAAVSHDRPACGNLLLARGSPRRSRSRARARSCSPTAARLPRIRAASSLYGAVTFAYSTSRTARLELLRQDVAQDVLPVEPGRREGRVLHPGRERVRHRMAEQYDEARLTVAVRGLVLVEEVLVARREVVVLVVRLARRSRGSRPVAGFAAACIAARPGLVDRRRRQAGVQPRVVRASGRAAPTASATRSAGCAARSGASRRCRASCRGAAGCRSRARPTSGRSRRTAPRPRPWTRS